MVLFCNTTRQDSSFPLVTCEKKRYICAWVVRINGYVLVIMVNAVPPNHVDDVPVVEPNQHDDVPVVPEPVLVDEDEDPKEEEFEEEEEP
ncbi:hypothetical protein Tco_0201082 [Tanacetum coccineum]